MDIGLLVLLIPIALGIIFILTIEAVRSDRPTGQAPHAPARWRGPSLSDWPSSHEQPVATRSPHDWTRSRH